MASRRMEGNEPSCETGEKSFEEGRYSWEDVNLSCDSYDRNPSAKRNNISSNLIPALFPIRSD